MGDSARILLGLVSLLLPAAAQARIIVHSAADLERGKAYYNASQEYQSLSAANVIFTQCPEQMYPSIAMDREYLAQRFAQVSQALVDAYYNNYVELVGYPPPQKMVDEYVARVRNLQQTTVNDTARTIRDQGCGNHLIEANIHYVYEAHAIAKATQKTTQGSQP